MKIHRFIGNFCLDGIRVESRSPDLINQVKNVLRLRIGDKVSLSDGKLSETIAKISLIRSDFIQFDILQKKIKSNEPRIYATLFCAILKKENFEWVVQKAAETGISQIVPVVSERTIKLGLKDERLKSIAREASEQCGRTIVPTIYSQLSFEEALTFARDNELNLIFDRSGKKKVENLRSNLEEKEKIGLFIGPEGGWTENEISLAGERKFIVVNLGKTILRAETAATVASYLITAI